MFFVEKEMQFSDWGQIGWGKMRPAFRAGHNSFQSFEANVRTGESRVTSRFRKFYKEDRSMKHINNMIARVLGSLMLSAALLCAWQADAQTTICDPSGNICLNSITINMFRDSRGDNDVFLTPGERLGFGANVVGGSLGTTLGAVYPPTGFLVSQVPCDPLATNANFCSRTTAFNPNRLQPWELIFQKGSAELRVSGPDLLGINNDSILQPFPHPTDVTISGSGTTPTISWTIPGGLVPDGFRVSIYDKRDHLGPDGLPDIIHNPELPGNATSYTLPPVFPDSGLSLVDGGLYTINFQLVETRNHVPFVRNADILRRSSSFFAFSPLPASAPPNVALPTISGGSFHFTIGNVGPNSVTFIDPPVAVGYDYATGPGDPNFKSVLLPQVGNNLFDLHLWNGSSYVFHATVQSGIEFSFPSGGVNRFRVLGIEAGAGLDPNNATAFITGLRFVSTGQFTGTMTPIVAEAFCSVLGNDPKPSLLDQDIYTLQGTQGEELRVRLEELMGGNKSSQASLILLDNIQGAVLLKTDSGTLPNEVSAVLPATGEYLAIVGELPLIARGNRFRGDYCLSVQSSASAAQTLQPTGWVE